MKKLLIVIAVLLSLTSKGQGPVIPPQGYTGISFRYDWLAGKFEAITLPGFSTTPTIRPGQTNSAGAFGIDTVLHACWFYSGGTWRRLASFTEIGTNFYVDTVYNRNDTLLYRKNGNEYFVSSFSSTPSASLQIDTTYHRLGTVIDSFNAVLKSFRIIQNSVELEPDTTDNTISYDIGTTGGGSQTLQQTFDTEIGGSILTKQDSILTDSFNLKIFGNPDFLPVVDIVSSGNSNGLNVISDVNGIKTTGANYGLQAISSNVPMWSVNNVTAGADVAAGLYIDRTGGGAGVNGMGVRILFSMDNTFAANSNASDIITQWADASSGLETSFLQFDLRNGGAALSPVLILNGDKSIQLTPITATAASAITPVEGMMLFVNNTNGTFTSIGFWGYQGGSWIKM